MIYKSWKAVAYDLADRLQYHEYCDNGHGSIDQGVDDGCPNCEDREAMRTFRVKKADS